MSDSSAAAVVERIVSGNRRELIDTLNLVEGSGRADRARLDALLDLLYPRSRRDGWVTGVTGAPGVGKSTLVGALAVELRARARTVAVLAVDPSSQRTGGALLGDRTRIRADPADVGLLVRSMASRGALGGVATAAADAIVVLRAAFDEVLVETVGVGQSEVDVAALADTTMLVLQPSAGDTLQLMKAGIMEVPDVIALNKSDLPDAPAAFAQIRAALGLATPDASGWTPDLAQLSASTRRGVDALVAALDRHREHLHQGDALRARRERARLEQVRERVRARCGALAFEVLGDDVATRLASEHPSASARSVAAIVERRFVEALAERHATRGDGQA